MPLDLRGILADQPRAQILHEADEPARETFRAELAVAGDAVVRPDGAEVPRAVGCEASVDDERLDAGDLHAASCRRRLVS